MEYVYIVIGNRSFFTGKICIVGVTEKFDYIREYQQPAFEAACKQLGVSESESSVLGFMYLGHDVHFVNISEVCDEKETN